MLKRQRLYININHLATVRQARRGDEPDPVAAALLCERSGADGITAHLREDRRHIQDGDIERLATEERRRNPDEPLHRPTPGRGEDLPRSGGRGDRAIPEIEELNIGHSVVSRAIFVGLTEAVRELRDVMDRARASS